MDENPIALVLISVHIGFLDRILERFERFDPEVLDGSISFRIPDGYLNIDINPDIALRDLQGSWERIEGVKSVQIIPAETLSSRA